MLTKPLHGIETLLLYGAFSKEIHRHVYHTIIVKENNGYPSKPPSPLISSRFERRLKCYGTWDRGQLNCGHLRRRHLRYFAAEPLRMINQHTRFMELCLDNDNPTLHYVKGINQCFFHHKSIKRLNHLRQSAYGKYDKGTYLCGLLLLCRGNIKREKSYWIPLTWNVVYLNPIADCCWRKIKRTS